MIVVGYWSASEEIADVEVIFRFVIYCHFKQYDGSLIDVFACMKQDIVEAIVNGAESDGLSIAQIMKNIPEDWNEQRRLYGLPER